MRLKVAIIVCSLATYYWVWRLVRHGAEAWTIAMLIISAMALALNVSVAIVGSGRDDGR